MNSGIINRLWIMAQLVRIQLLETEVTSILASEKTPGTALIRRVAELKFQLSLLELALN